MKYFLRIFFACSIMLLATTVYSEPRLIYQYGGRTGMKIIGVNGLISVETPMVSPGDNCDQRIADVVVGKVVYREATGAVVGFQALKPSPKPWYGLFTIDEGSVYRAIPNDAHVYIHELIKKGAQLIVIYQVCGSGGYKSVIDIFKKSAVNNP